MSFILDALRKSEHERQRQTGPALAEISVAQPRPRINAWATAAVALLVVNLVAVGVLLLRKAGREPTAAATAAVPARTPASEAPPAQQPPSVSITRTAPAPVAPPSSTPPMLQPARESDPPTMSARNPLAEEVSDGPPALDDHVAAQASAPPAGPPAVTQTPHRPGTVVYESLPDSATLGTSANAVRPAGGTAGAGRPSLPSADDLAASGSVPALNLDLHVYSTKPGESMVFINSQKYREGDTLREGPVVQQITREVVILEYRGSRFFLSNN